MPTRVGGRDAVRGASDDVVAKRSPDRSPAIAVEVEDGTMASGVAARVAPPAGVNPLDARSACRNGSGEGFGVAAVAAVFSDAFVGAAFGESVVDGTSDGGCAPMAAAAKSRTPAGTPKPPAEIVSFVAAESDVAVIASPSPSIDGDSIGARPEAGR